jgi:hypothetical protein
MADLPFLGLDTKEPAEVRLSTRTNQKEALGWIVYKKYVLHAYLLLLLFSTEYDGNDGNLSSGVPVSGRHKYCLLNRPKDRFKGTGQSFPCGILRVLSSLDLLVRPA